jgi:sarcinarray family protein
MRKTLFFLCLLVLLVVTSTCPLGTAGECTYGSLQAWFRTPGSEWHNATAHPLLKRGQEFEIKITVTAKNTLQVLFVKLHEFGTPVFEVVEGPTKMEQLLEYRQMIQPNQMFTSTWKLRVRPDTTWVNGYSPLEVFAQFNRNDDNECRVSFDVITAFVIDELWAEYTPDYTNSTAESEDEHHEMLSCFEIGGVLVAAILLCFFIRLREH